MFFEWRLDVVSEDTSQGAAAFVRKGDLENYKLPKLVVVMQYVTDIYAHVHLFILFLFTE